MYIYIYYIYIVIEVRHDSQYFIFFRGICDAVAMSHVSWELQQTWNWHGISCQTQERTFWVPFTCFWSRFMRAWTLGTGIPPALKLTCFRWVGLKICKDNAGTSRFSWVILHTACFNFPDSEFLLSFKQLPRKCSSGPCASWPSSSATCPHLDKELVDQKLVLAPQTNDAMMWKVQALAR